MRRKTFKFNDEELYFNIHNYSNDRLCVLVETKEEPYCDLTINLPEAFVDRLSMAFIDTTAKDSGLEEALINAKIIKEIVCVDDYNYGKYDCVLFDLKKLKEYDPKGFEKFLDVAGFEERIGYCHKL